MTETTALPELRQCRIMGCSRSARKDDYGYCSKHNTWLPEGHRERYQIVKALARQEIERRG